MVLPFFVEILWYRESRVYASVISMFVGFIATLCWKYGVENQFDISPPLFGFAVAVIVFLAAVGPRAPSALLGGERATLKVKKTCPRIARMYTNNATALPNARAMAVDHSR